MVLEDSILLCSGLVTHPGSAEWIDLLHLQPAHRKESCSEQLPFKEVRLVRLIDFSALLPVSQILTSTVKQLKALGR